MFWYNKIMTKTYIHESTEVVLTGREAVRTIGAKSHVLYEITPFDKESGSWKKWVPFTDLYEVQDGNKQS